MKKLLRKIKMFFGLGGWNRVETNGSITLVNNVTNFDNYRPRPSWNTQGFYYKKHEEPSE